MVNDDRQMWMMGQYVMSAFGVVLAHAFGKGTDASYLDRPMLEKSIKDKEDAERFANMSEAEKKEYTEKLFMQLSVIGNNFNLTHGKGVE